MAAGSLKPFYLVLGAIAVGGAALIGRAMRSSASAPLPLQTAGVSTAGPRGVVIGSESAPVELMEFSDFECPWCARYAVLQVPDIKARLVEGGRLRVRFMHYPLDNHTKSPQAHLAAACAHEQGRFWEMHDLLFENQDDWLRAGSPERLLAGYAERLRLDMTRYRSCVAERRPWNQVLADKAVGDSLRVGGTPTFYLNGRLLDETPTADVLLRLVDSIAPLPAAPTR
jgi:protein-disulfide isomerase